MLRMKRSGLCFPPWRMHKSNAIIKASEYGKGEKMQIFLCDDEPQILKDIENRIKLVKRECQVTSFSNGEILLEALRSSSCDVLFLDIDMPEISGLDIAERLDGLPQKPLLVFVTSHDELVYDSLQFHPFGFIRKSHFDAEIEKLLRDCAQELAAKERHFTFKSGNENVRIKLSEILYFESDGNYLKLYAKDQEYRLRDTVTAVENTLSANGFIRLHRGFLVNQEAVKMLGAEEAELVNGAKVPIGRNYAQEAKSRLMRYMLK